MGFTCYSQSTQAGGLHWSGPKKTDLSDHGIAHPGVKTRETLHIKSPGSSTEHRDMLGNGGVRCSLSDTHHNTCLHQSFVAPHAETQRESLTCSGGRTVWKERSCETVTPNVECTNHRGIPSSLLKVLSDALTQPPGRAFLGQGQSLHPWSRQTAAQCYCWGLCLQHHMLTYTPITVCFFFPVMGRSTNLAFYLLAGAP